MPIDVRDEGRVRVVSIDRARAFNALDPEHFRALDAAIGAAMEAEGVRVVVLGATGRTFSIGADVTAFHEASAAGRLEPLFRELLPVFQRTILQLAEGPKPSIAAVVGPAAGAGLDLALACDLRVVGDGASMSTAYGRVGIVPDGGAPHHLRRLLGAARAAELLLLPDRVVTPAEAVAWGLAMEAVPRERVVPRAVEIAQKIAAGPAVATRLVRGLLREDGTRILSDALEAEAAAQLVAIAHPDAAEGVAAAKERRPPRFR
jgi:2-(1,2-epoxy-1,2-dihydrophenyl)acetyl-CoA isomerase